LNVKGENERGTLITPRNIPLKKRCPIADHSSLKGGLKFSSFGLSLGLFIREYYWGMCKLWDGWLKYLEYFEPFNPKRSRN